MSLKIEKIINEGYGLGRQESDRPVFVYKSAPDDQIEVNILEDKKSFAKGSIQRIIEPSPIRINPECPDYNSCGGCEFQHLSYQSQLTIKEKVLLEVLDRNKITTKPEPIIAGSNHTFFYRNVIRFFMVTDQNNQIGFAMNHFDYKQGLIPIESCLLQSDLSNRILQALKNFINENIEDKSTFWQLRIREGKFTGEFMIEIITQKDDLPEKQGIVTTLKTFPEIKSIYHAVAENSKLTNLKRRLLFGKPVIMEKIGKFTFQISPESFFQTNSLGVKTLYDNIKKVANITPDDNLLDLYCGTGTIGIYLSILAKSVTGVEIVSEAIRDAHDNAKINHIENIDFVCADATRWLEKNSSLIKKINKIIVDPPRNGLDKKLLDRLSNLNNFSDLIYVSCNPATFARDAKILEENGLKITHLQPIDMFPQTHHLELVSVFKK